MRVVGSSLYGAIVNLEIVVDVSVADEPPNLFIREHAKDIDSFIDTLNVSGTLKHLQIKAFPMSGSGVRSNGINLLRGLDSFAITGAGPSGAHHSSFPEWRPYLEAEEERLRRIVLNDAALAKLGLQRA